MIILLPISLNQETTKASKLCHHSWDRP